MNSGNYRSRIEQKLTAALQPILLEIKDDSALHVGHSGHHPQGESHFSVHIVSPAFEGLPLVARHQTVYRLLASELAEHVHALALHTLAPSEYTHR